MKNLIKKALNSNRYRALEKIEHETQMRLKGWTIEQSIYLFPLFLFVGGYFFYWLLQLSLADFGEEIPFFTPTFFLSFVAGIVTTIGGYVFLGNEITEEIDRQEQELTQDVYVKGAKFTNSTAFNESMLRYIEDEYKIAKDPKVKELFKIPITKLANEEDKRYELNPEPYIYIPRISLATGLCILGSPGRGKSVLLKQLVSQIKNNAKQIIVDVKGEFVESFYDPSQDIIICPADARSVKFDLYELVENKFDVASIAKTIVEDDKHTTDPHWVESARLVMEGVLHYAAKNSCTNKEIYEIVFDNNKLNSIKKDRDVYLLCGGYLNFEDGNPTKETASILTTLRRKAKILEYLAILDESDAKKINLKEWLLDNRGGKVFLLSDDNLSKVFAPLYGTLISYWISMLLSKKDDSTKDYYFILDETPRLGKVLGENLEKLLAVGRSKGAKVITVAQSYAQYKKVFGEHEADAILDTINSFIVFQSNIGSQFLEKYFGKTTLIRNNESFSFGMENMSDRVSISRQIVKESVIDDAEINRLNKFEFYAKVEGCPDILKSRLKFVKIEGYGNERIIRNDLARIDRELKTAFADVSLVYARIDKDPIFAQF